MHICDRWITEQETGLFSDCFGLCLLLCKVFYTIRPRNDEVARVWAISDYRTLRHCEAYNDASVILDDDISRSNLFK